DLDRDAVGRAHERGPSGVDAVEPICRRRPCLLEQLRTPHVRVPVLGAPERPVDRKHRHRASLVASPITPTADAAPRIVQPSPPPTGAAASDSTSADTPTPPTTRRATATARIT